MYQKIYQHTKKQGLFKSHKRVLIAVSSGVDSMNLLHFLHFYKDELQIEIAIAHVNHKQRKQSDEEEKFLQNWAKENQIPLFIKHFSGIFSEKKARDFRYAFFKEIMISYNYSALVTAHHANDQAETVLMRIVRGTLLRHLQAIQEVQDFGNGQLIRPFLTFNKEQLPNVFHFDDYSNQENHYFRNRVRNLYLRDLAKENPRIQEALTDLARESHLLFTALKELTDSYEKTDLSFFQSQSYAVQYYLLQEYIAKFSDLKLSKTQFKDIHSILTSKNNGIFPINSSYQLILSRKSFEIQKIMLETEVYKQKLLLKYGSMHDYKGYSFSFESIGTIKPHDISIPIYDTSPITLRGRNEGDVISFGSFSKKLRRLFIDEKYSIQERNEAIIGLQNDIIIFVIVADKTYLRKMAENDIMRATLYIENLEKR